MLPFIGSELFQFEELHKIDTELAVLATNILEAVREKSRLGKEGWLHAYLDQLMKI